jgi:hypothetical protein
METAAIVLACWVAASIVLGIGWAAGGRER